MSEQNKCRCAWLDATKPDYVKYHDEEWGVPLYDDTKLFEFITLESAQAGLSWYTILKKRAGYKKAFANFNVQKVANFTADDIERLMQDESIVRNRLKIAATVNNAQRFIEIQKEFGSFSNYQWQFVGNKPIISDLNSVEDTPAITEESKAFAKDLKKRGFKFLGPTTVYAHMQACGMVNDHSNDCFRKEEIIKAFSE
ncbi:MULTISPECIES: DNA-3-methyladenine glycosylase I [Pseudoalteromonas]|uniref:DNA-3-methyladenine glycosylase I n=1 Tax=Pseudoalteromonas TaxID=53246 RepID=UPI0002CC5DFA|nr:MULTISPECIES: DNA-3-methyladenine glycosylase I [Pseudoalteromonas]MCP4058755.1 DNA-3-methyladenine glycosylase I [Pseudoalteromonas sp.]ENN98163.1 3-methyladenine DNA glycosylase [Pseudoalteromonas agarivorans S816]MCK8105884.1 DNA-3-methyladenine glycosylase I [Pseudoalteromonas sp. 2CM41L]MCK8118400.1 DNA-3-methyladenine glycosylase I [Pseudoalteromonas sp. 2CM37A]MDI3245156.1 DNA-3-methyladenine glycosylase I [Pseudoalteromonas agarivorans]|tara:strand:- start:283 stop:876 length:594 start_codon:yes stop_codon:yes gene_type:complete